LALALFQWKKGGSEGKDAGGDATKSAAGGDDGKIEFSPEKAEKFFSVARNRHEVGSFDYAANMWLQGLRFDPNNLNAVKGFFTSVSGHVGATGAKSPTKDLEAAVSGRTPVHKYLGHLLAWSFDQFTPDKGVKAGVSAADLGLREVALYLLPTAAKLSLKSERPRKEHLVKIMEASEKVEDFDTALVAGDAAVRMDISDGKLAAHVKSLAAQSTMNKGGYSQTGEAGGFRSNVRNLDQQRQLEEGDRIVKSESALDRNVAAAKQQLAQTPGDRPTIVKYVKALMERGTKADEDEASAVLMKAYAETQEFRFRQTAGELRMKQGRRRMRELKAAMDAAPADAQAKAAFLEADKAQVALETAEFEAVVAAYPTDLKSKYELGLRYLAAGRQTDAIGQLQQAKTDGKLKHQAALKLGLAFLGIDWLDEAVETLRTAVSEYPDGNDDMGLELRYELMVALKKKGAANRDMASVEEADKLASAIGMQNIGYKDIRDQRTQIKALLAELKAG
jgi:tetratricopeptide (TPR) repeat protein